MHDTQHQAVELTADIRTRVPQGQGLSYFRGSQPPCNGAGSSGAPVVKHFTWLDRRGRMRTGDRGGGGGCVEEDAQAVQVVHRQALTAVRLSRVAIWRSLVNLSRTDQSMRLEA